MRIRGSGPILRGMSAHGSRPGLGAICASSALAVGIALMAHESAHVLAGRIAGGSPTLLTSTEVQGDFDSLSPAGLVALGVSGSLANVLLCGLGAWALGRGPAIAEVRLSAWFFFAVNGMLVSTKMMAEPLIGVGDWMTVLKPLSGTTLLRALVAALGSAGVIFMVRRSGRALAGLVPPSPPERRPAEGLRIVSIGAVAAVVLVLGASVASPVGTSRAFVLALGGGLGPFIPMYFGVRFVARTPVDAPDALAPGGWPWLLATGVVVAVLWFGFGPGIELSFAR